MPGDGISDLPKRGEGWAGEAQRLKVEATEIVATWLNKGGTPDNPTSCNGYQLLNANATKMENMLVDLVKTALRKT